MRVLVFGDSITQGYWDTEGGWVDRLRKSYDELQVQDLQGRDDPTIFNLGVSADTTRDILARIEAETIARTRHGNLPIVVVQIGVNDSSTDHGTVRVELATYKQNLIAIIEKMKPLSSRLIFVGLSGCDETKTTPTAWGNYHYTNAAIKAYETAMSDIAHSYGVPFMVVFDSFMAVAAANTHLLPDGLHPNNEGHELICKIVRSRLNELLV
jgi:lysophospholipase L1-like esterase